MAGDGSGPGSSPDGDSTFRRKKRDGLMFNSENVSIKQAADNFSLVQPSPLPVIGHSSLLAG